MTKQFVITIDLPEATSRPNFLWLDEFSSQEELHDYIQDGIEKGLLWPELSNKIKLENVVTR